jgi:rare lipoprotein A
MRSTWYGLESCQRPPPNCRTANGDKFTGNAMTAAHRTLPFGTKLRVSYKGKSVTVVVNDRGPAAYTGNDLDLSKAAAKAVGLWRIGRDYVCVTRL